LAGRTFDADFALVILHNPPSNGKAQPCAAGPVREKGIENVRQIGRGNSAARIFDDERQARILGGGLDAHAYDASLFFHGLSRVEDDVEDSLDKLGLIG
jgi:hypothetical protein